MVIDEIQADKSKAVPANEDGWPDNRFYGEHTGGVIELKQITQLPEHFVERGSVDLTKDFKLLVKLQAAAFLAVILSGWLFLNLTYFLRPDSGELLSVSSLLGFESTNGLNLRISLSMFMLVSLLVATVLMIILHEAVHGVAFWLFTGKRPTFGFKLFYAYAASPKGIYLPRQQYFIVALAPLIFLTLAGIALIPVVPLVALPTLVFFLVGNAAGAIGDVWVVGWLMREPPEILLQDRGDAVTCYGPPST